MLAGPTIIVTLKVLVVAVTLLYAAALTALARGQLWWHGRLNTLFFILTMATVIGFEGLIRFGIDMTSTFSDDARHALRIHLMFSVPAALVLPMMMLSGTRHWRRLHVPLGVVFCILWLGTLITGLLLPTK